MNICMISSDYLPNIGGIAAHVDEMAHALVALGNHVDILNVSFSNESNFTVSDHNPRIYRLQIKPFLPYVNRLMYKSKGGRLLKTLMIENHYDVVHWHDLFEGASLAETVKGKTRIVWTNHTSEFLQWFTDKRRRKEMQRAFGFADRMIAPSRELAEKAGDLFGREVFYISNGVDTGRFYPRDTRKDQIEMDPHHYLVLCPRRLDPKNGIEHLVLAMPKILEGIPNGLLLVVGSLWDKSHFRKLEAIVAKENLKEAVIFAGPVANDKMIDYYNAADIVVLPSLMEATSIAGLEAMACGRPIVATNVGGIPEIIVSGREGLLVDPAKPQELAEAVIDIHNNMDLSLRLGKASRVRAVNEFSWKVIAQRTLQAYRS